MRSCTVIETWNISTKKIPVQYIHYTCYSNYRPALRKVLMFSLGVIVSLGVATVRFRPDDLRDDALRFADEPNNC